MQPGPAGSWPSMRGVQDTKWVCWPSTPPPHPRGPCGQRSHHKYPFAIFPFVSKNPRSSPGVRERWLVDVQGQLAGVLMTCWGPATLSPQSLSAGLHHVAQGRERETQPWQEQTVLDRVSPCASPRPSLAPPPQQAVQRRGGGEPHPPVPQTEKDSVTLLSAPTPPSGASEKLAGLTSTQRRCRAWPLVV